MHAHERLKPRWLYIDKPLFEQTCSVFLLIDLLSQTKYANTTAGFELRTTLWLPAQLISQVYYISQSCIMRLITHA